MAAERLKIRNDYFDLPFLGEFTQAPNTLSGLAHTDQIFHDCSTISNSIVHIGKPKTIDLGYLKVFT